MKIVIQCAASKDRDAGAMRTKDRTPVVFVAHPKNAPPTSNHVYAHPDDRADDGRRWREIVLDTNAQPNGNPLGLLPAWRLYRHAAYGKLVERYGTDNVFILSAGWGLIRADFLTPAYDITFSTQADAFKRRKRSDVYADFNMLDARETEPLAFFGGKDYLPLFCMLTRHYAGRRIAAFNSAVEPQTSSIRFVRYRTRTRTNWHYEAVNALLDGAFLPA